jgi:hypothetical protein
MKRLLAVSLAVVAAAALAGCSSGSDEVTVESAQSFGRELQLTLNSCTDEDPVVEVTEDPGAVRVVAHVDGEYQGDCLQGATVTLEQPVGDRQLIDDVAGRAVYVAQYDEDGRWLNPPDG